MTDPTPNSLSPQGEHAPGPAPLSTSAQAVLDAVSDKYRTFVFIEYDDENPFAVKNPVSKIAAAAIRALADQVASPIPDDCRYDVFNRQLDIRAKLLAIATELEGQ